VVDPAAPLPPEYDDDLATVLGPARLAFFTPVFEQPTLADRKAMFILGASGLLVTVLMFFAPPRDPGAGPRAAGRGTARPRVRAAAAVLPRLRVAIR
jgi:hypothetical protein